jgi:hypothetical protein
MSGLKSTLAWLLSVILVCLSVPVHALNVAGVSFPDSKQLVDTTLRLNGAGVREYSFLRIKVYAAALYLPVVTNDAQAILDLRGPRLLQMHFLRGASQEDTRKAWLVYLKKNCTANCVWPASAVAKFLAVIPETRRESTQTYVFEFDHVDIFDNQTLLIRLVDPVFPRLLLSTWIGAEPSTEALKRALLGISP